MNRKASVVWHGELKSGSGKITTESGALKETPYSFKTRFEQEEGTNPEELIAAAHAGCFTMAFANQLGELGFTPESIETTAAVTLKKGDEGWNISTVHLETRPNVPLANESDVREAALFAKENCPVSRLLKASITMEVSFPDEDERPVRLRRDEKSASV